MPDQRAYLTRKDLGKRLSMSPRTAGEWIQREAPEAVLRINRRVLRYDAGAVLRLERQLRGCGELLSRLDKSKVL